MDYLDLYDFCLDWQMGYIEKETLKDQFKGYGWDFNEFMLTATEKMWFVSSMLELRDI